MTDIKQALAAAFDDEPPLTIDRAAILRTGRRKAAFRRGYTVITMLATATVVCVPAMLGSGGGGGDGNTQVGGSAPARSTTPTGVGASTTASPPAVTGTPQTGSSSPDVVTNEPSPPTRTSFSAPEPPKPPTSRRATDLTALLASSGAIPADAQSRQYPGHPAGPWEFGVVEGGYEAVADVTTGAGRGRVTVDLGGGEAPKCGPAFTNPKSTCEERLFEGRPIVVTVLTSDDAQPVTFISVRARRADGTVVEANSMNGDAQKSGITGANPPLSVEQLAKIATLPGLTF